MSTWAIAVAVVLSFAGSMQDVPLPRPGTGTHAAVISAQRATRRPTVGLALGGGAARGLAHIGLLRWFEEHRIPIDFIAGTSMGGLVGGAYASGMSPDEIQQLMTHADWDLMFLADSPFTYKTFRRKEDARAFPGQLDFGLKGGFRLPSGLNAGQQIELMLDRIALPYYQLRDFDDLPTPFRCVATDIRKSEAVVLGRGSFARALRATMAIPAVFTPVVLDQRLLVDGGALNNVPADVVKTMGADVAIAVNVGSSAEEGPVPRTLFAVLGETLDSMMTAGTRRALESADLVVVPDLRGFTGGEWRRTDELAARGYKAAADLEAKLLPYQVDESAYAAWKQARLARRRVETPVVQKVVVEGLPPAEAKVIATRLEARHVGRTLAQEEIETSILAVSGTDRYELITYGLRALDGDAALVVNVSPKDYGPPFLLPAIDLQNIDSNSFAMNLRARLAVYDAPLRNSEIRFDVAVGTEQVVRLELYKRLGTRGLFVAPHVSFERRSLNAFVEGDLVGDYRVKRTGAGLDAGYTLMRQEVRVGYDVVDVRARRRVGLPLLPEATGSDRVASLRWVFDGQNSPMVPSRGLRVGTAFRYYFQTPDIVDQEGVVVRRSSDVPQGEAAASWFKRIGRRQRGFLAGGAGTSFGHDPGFNQFALGGPLRLGAYSNEELRGANYLVATAGLLHEWFRLPDILGGNAYLGGWLEQGSAFDAWREAQYKADVSAGVIIETLVGPVFLAYSQSLVDSRGRFYISLGPFLK